MTSCSGRSTRSKYGGSWERRWRSPGGCRRRPSIAEPQPDLDADGAILGCSPSMCEVYKAIGRVAAQGVPVLITGETGTGKELAARAIYRYGAPAEPEIPARG